MVDAKTAAAGVILATDVEKGGQAPADAQNLMENQSAPEPVPVFQRTVDESLLLIWPFG
jgi:hypothetical protein